MVILPMDAFGNSILIQATHLPDRPKDDESDGATLDMISNGSLGGHRQLSLSGKYCDKVFSYLAT